MLRTGNKVFGNMWEWEKTPPLPPKGDAIIFKTVSLHSSLLSLKKTAFLFLPLRPCAALIAGTCRWMELQRQEPLGADPAEMLAPGLLQRPPALPHVRDRHSQAAPFKERASVHSSWIQVKISSEKKRNRCYFLSDMLCRSIIGIQLP